jgi:hypothetical protein
MIGCNCLFLVKYLKMRGSRGGKNHQGCGCKWLYRRISNIRCEKQSPRHRVLDLSPLICFYFYFHSVHKHHNKCII